MAGGSSAVAGAAAAAGWNIVTAPVTGAGNDILLGSACANSVTCWAVGATLANGGEADALIEGWNGSSWSLADTPVTPGFPGAVLFGATCWGGAECWAVGGGTGSQGGDATGVLTEEWNGAGWKYVPAPTPAGAVAGFLEGVNCVASSDCWAVGFTTDSNGGALNALTEHWNGSTWSVVAAAGSGQTYDQLVGVSCVTPSDCWAVGSAGPVQQNPNFLPIFPRAVGDQGLVEHWDGTRWSAVTSPNFPAPSGAYLSGITCVTAVDCWTSGSTTDSSGTSSGALMEHWNGSDWSTTATPDPPGSSASILDGVACTGASHCWASGSVGPFGGGGGSQFQPNHFIESWNGSSWSIQPSPDVTALSFLSSVTCQANSACWVVGSSDSGVTTQFNSLIEQLVLPAATTQGLVMSAGDGGIFAFGNAAFYGSMGGSHLNAPVVGVASTPDGGGYWEVASDGGIFAFGNAAFYGSMGGSHLNAPVVGIASTPDGGGYWEVASDGGIFAFGDATFDGSMGGSHLNAPVVGVASTPDGGGYWEVASDGGIFAFGDATFYGSTGSMALNRPIAGMTANPNGRGYWLVASDGGVFTFGSTGYFGSVPGQQIVSAVPVVGISATPDGRGYWLVGDDGSLYSYGDARFLGSLVGTPLVAPVSGMAST